MGERQLGTGGGESPGAALNLASMGAEDQAKTQAEGRQGCRSSP